VIEPYVKGFIKCSMASTQWSYGFNERLSRLNPERVEAWDKTIVLFEANGRGPNPYGGPESVDARHHGTSFVGLLDGQASRLTEAHKFRWEP
jgi:hypothetical protein